MTCEFTDFKILLWKNGSVFFLTGGNVLYASEMQTHLSLLKKMEGLSRYHTGEISISASTWKKEHVSFSYRTNVNQALHYKQGNQNLDKGSYVHVG